MVIQEHELENANPYRQIRVEKKNKNKEEKKGSALSE